MQNMLLMSPQVEVKEEDESEEEDKEKEKTRKKQTVYDYEQVRSPPVVTAGGDRAICRLILRRRSG